MCVYKRYVLNRRGRRILVKCGHCPACLQEKALNRANRIRNNFNYNGGQLCLFFGLTYRNEACPYFDLDEYDNSPTYFDSLRSRGLSTDGEDNFKTAIVRRDISHRWFYDPSVGHLRHGVKHGDFVLNTVAVTPGLSFKNIQFLKNQPHKRVGVCYYPDVQNFIKRLRINLQRNYNYEKSFSFYCCSEYGEDTCRPHFHCLLFIPQGDYKLFKKAIAKAWPYDDYHRTFNSVEIAKDAAAYVSTYVNCSSYVPQVLRDTPGFAPSHSYSKGFGVGTYAFSLSQVLSSFRRADLRYDVQRNRKGASVVERFLFPFYVVSRYFPKFKGYSSLTPNEIVDVFIQPERLARYVTKTKMNLSDLHKTKVMLLHKQALSLTHHIPLIDYAEAYANIWNLYYSNRYRDYYEQILKPSDFFTAYDNIIDFYSQRVLSPTLDDFVQYVKKPVVDPNYFPNNLTEDRNLRYWFDTYSKDKKIRNHIYSQLGYNL